MFAVFVLFVLVAFIMWFVPREYRKQQIQYSRDLREYFLLNKNEEAQK